MWVAKHRPWYRRKRFIPLWLLLALIVLGVAVGDGEDTTTPPTSAVAPEALASPEGDRGPVAAEEEAARVAAEQEAARQAEAARVAAEQEAARQAEAARVAAEQEAARVAAEQEAARQAEAARVAAEQEAARAAAERAQAQSRADVYYANCTAVRAAGAAPIRRGDPGYAARLDRDGDGVGCER